MKRQAALGCNQISLQGKHAVSRQEASELVLFVWVIALILLLRQPSSGDETRDEYFF